MRAYGVLLVLVYHFFPAVLPGGFIGVDIFFVVSGYLITSLLIREFESSGKLKLLDFYRRRWRRLFPAILVMLLVFVALSLLISPDFRVDITRQSAAALSWMTNSYELAMGQSYEAQLLPHLFIHTWTLSIEMQYYLIWGAIVFAVLLAFGLLSRVATRHTRKDGENKRTSRSLPIRITLATIAVVLATTSVVAMQNAAAGVRDPSVAYLSTLSHLFPLMIGSMFACFGGFAPYKPQLSAPAFKPVSLVVIALGVATLAFVALTFSFQDPRTYQFGILLVSFVTAIILYLARLWQDLSSKSEWRFTNYVGLRSYSIYLYHWPLMIIATQLAQQLGITPAAAALWAGAFGIPLTFLAAELSYRWVEQPFRVRRRSEREDNLTGKHEPASNKPTGNHGPASKLQPLLVAKISAVVLLCILSIGAFVSAPQITSIEASLRQGAQSLSISNIENAYERTQQEVAHE
jgi:peptidoglycan/LPS O-acetylase OafA/YrhL